MADTGLTRKLAAILYADVAEYSRLTGADEEGTHKTLSTYLDAVTAHIGEHGWRVLHYAGDAVLAEFASAVVAVGCAVDVQRDLAARNERLAQDRRVRFRIGVNLGDVIVDRDELYGDSVKVAARLEALTEPGGICISRKVLDEVGDKLDIGYAFLGEKSVKNIEQPIPVYRVVLALEKAGAVTGEASPAPNRLAVWVATVTAALAIIAAVALWRAAPPEAPPATAEKPAFPLPEKPSIAVLPFDNLNGDPGQEHVADGVTDDIITALSQVSDMFVIARNSTFTYKGRAVKVQEVATDLGVRYVLEGSLQKSGDAVRIHAQLIDSKTARHLWAERYDRQMTDLFALQDEITDRIVTALRIELTDGEQMRVRRKHTRNLRAWNLVAKGVEHFYRRNRADNAEARRFFGEAIEADPGHALAWAMAAWTHWFDAQFGWSGEPQAAFENARLMAEKARALDAELPDVYGLLSAIHLFDGQHEAAVAAGEKAVALDPNHSTNTALLAMFLHSAGRSEGSIKKMKRAMRLSPYYPAWYLEILGFAYLKAEQPDEALAAFAQFLEREPSGHHAAHAHLGRALVHHGHGRTDAARQAVRDATDADSSFSATRFSMDSLNKDVGGFRESIAIPRDLGLPD